MLIFLGGPDVTRNRCCPHFLALVMHAVRGSEVKHTEEELSVLLATLSERSSPRLRIGILG